MEKYETRLEREQRFHDSEDWRNNRAHLGKYRAIFTDKQGTTAYRDKIIKQNASPENTVFLEYGCGDGAYLIEIAKNIKKGIGIDISQQEIEIAENRRKKLGIDNIGFYVMDAMKTTFNNGTFDIIHGNAILHHLDLEKSIKEMTRILKDDGICVFIEPLAANPFITLYRKLTPKLRTEDEQPFRKKEIKIMKKYFENIEIKYYGGLTLLAVPLRNNKYFEQILNVLYKLDNIILGKKSPLKFFAWICVMVCKK